MTRLSRLFRPRSVAVIGGGTWCANVIEECRKIGYSGDIWAVHTSKNMIAGCKAFASVDDLPGAPDAAFIGVNRDATIDVVAALAARGAGGAVCFASGFREASGEIADGDELQARLIAAAGDMPILGPNCYGFINYLDAAALWPDQHGGVVVDRGVAIITQSSNIAINLTMQRRGLPVAYVVTVGNQAQTDLSQIGAALLDDPRVTALGLHIEGINDLRGFEALATKARDLGKPVIALKIGKSDQARAATISHTASLAGSDAGARALLARLGIGQVASLSVFLEALKLLHVAGPLASNRIASLSCSGGEASLMADCADGSGLIFPALNDTQAVNLRHTLGPRVALANPLDYHTYIWGDQAAMTATFTAMMGQGLAMGCVVLDFPRADRCAFDAWRLVINSVRDTQAVTGIPMAIIGSLAESIPEDIAAELVAMNIVPFCGLEEAVQAMAVAAKLGMQTPSLPLLLPAAPRQTRILSEVQAKQELQKFGVSVPRALRADSPEKAEICAAELGFPVVLKGEGIAHKSDAGAVRLNLCDAAAVRAAAQDMPCETFIIEEMIPPALVELLIGVVLDPAHGYVLTLAAGGVLTEIMQDSTSLLLPVSKGDVTQALNSLRIAPQFAGYRGAAAVDMDAVMSAIMAVQAFAVAHAGRLAEIEINPLICSARGAVAADALIRVGGKDD